MHNRILFSLLTVIVLSYVLSLTTSSRMLFHVLLPKAMAGVNQTSNNYNNVTSFITFENLTYGIKLLYPSNWNKEQNLGGSSSNNSKLIDIVRFSPLFQKNKSDKSAENLDVKVDNISDIQPVTLAKYTNDTIVDLGKDFKIISLEKNATMSGGNPAYRLEYTGIEQDVNLNAMVIFTLKGDKAYIISYTAEPARYSSDLPMIQKMINSIQIIK